MNMALTVNEGFRRTVENPQKATAPFWLWRYYMFTVYVYYGNPRLDAKTIMFTCKSESLGARHMSG